MKTYIALIILVLGVSTTSAQPARQDTTLVFSRPGYVKDPVRSNWKQVVTEKENSWLISLYDGKLLREEITYEDKDLHVRKGPYTQYYEKGNIAYQGNFDKGYRVGEWRFYYKDKQLAEKLTYTWGKLNGEYVSFWENGNVKSRGKYVMDKKTGTFRIYYQNEKLAAEENYNQEGMLIDSRYFDEEGKSTDRRPEIDRQ